MYHLSRIRATGIGPTDARFDQPSPDHAPFEISCLNAADEPDDTLLWLENGGGKTVFLALLFHVLQPGKAALIGGDGDAAPGTQRRRGAIDEYLLTGDVGHVLCEWVSTDSDERLVTGMVAEKRGTGVQRSWYMLVVRSSAFSLDQLVFNADGRRIRPGPFLESLHEIARSSANGRRRSIDCFVATTQKQWLALLADHSLDPTLFEYQAQMNKAEGKAASLFRFRSPAEFVEFFIRLTMNPESLAKVSETLGLVAEKVADLPRKELDLAYCTEAAAKLDTLAGAFRAHRSALAADVSARAGAEALDDALAAALARLMKRSQMRPKTSRSPKASNKTQTAPDARPSVAPRLWLSRQPTLWLPRSRVTKRQQDSPVARLNSSRAPGESSPSSCVATASGVNSPSYAASSTTRPHRCASAATRSSQHCANV